MATPDKTDVGIVIEPVSEMTCSVCSARVDVSASVPFSEVHCPSCAASLCVSARLGPFRLLSRLGSGGMGAVYQAQDETLGRRVAVKVMQISVGEDAEFVETFKREAQAAAKLNHPNIAQIYSFGQEKGQPYIVMELVSGDGLDKMIGTGEPIDQALVMQIAADIASGLSAAAEIGLTHGDIKPENILLDDKMNAKLVDFGIATFAHQSDNRGVWGTPYYISPERVRRQRVDQRSDIYSLGATLYHALTGKPPFDGQSPMEVVKARLDQPPRPMVEIRPDIDPRIVPIIERMLQLEPAMRYPNYVSLINDIRKVLDTMAPAHRTSGRGKKIVIKKGSKTIVTPLSATARTEGGKPGTLVLHKGATATVKPLTGATEEAQKGHPVAKAVGVILLILALIGAAAVAIPHIVKKREATEAQRQQVDALQRARSAAAEVFGGILLTVTNMVQAAQPCPGYLDEAADAVLFVTGSALVREPSPPTAPGTGTNATVSADARKPAVSPADDGTAAVTPETVSTNEVPADEPPPESAPKEDPEIVVLANQVVAGVRMIQEQTAKAEDLAKQAAVEKDALAAEPGMDAIVKHMDVLRGHLKTVEELAKTSRKAGSEAEGALKRVRDLRAFETRRREEQSKRDEEDARRQAEEEARRQAEEQRRAVIEQEVAALDALRRELDPLVKRNEFRAAADRARAARNDYQTENGKTGIAVMAERYERLEGLKAFIIERLNTDPFKWGLGVGATARDIVSANAVTIHTREGRTNWEFIDPAQMAKFFNRYLGSREVKLVTLAEQNLAAAIYCNEHGFNDAALDYRTKAIGYNPNIESTAKRLLPLD